MPALLGVRAHDLGRRSPEELADLAAGLGFSAIQLAPRKALAGFGTETRLEPKDARALGRLFRSRGLAVAVLGSYINPIHPDPACREEELARFERDLEFAAELGAPLVGTETGTLHPGLPQVAASRGQALDVLARSMERLLKKAESFGLTVALEAAWPHAARGAPELGELAKKLDHPHLGFILDSANLVGPGEEGRVNERALEALRLYGDRLKAIHAKDVVPGSGSPRIVPAFTGLIAWKPLVQTAEERCLPVLFEDGRPSELAEAALAWKAFAARL